MGAPRRSGAFTAALRKAALANGPGRVQVIRVGNLLRPAASAVVSLRVRAAVVVVSVEIE